MVASSTYFFSKPRNVLNFDESSRSSLSEGTAAAVGGAVGLGVLGLVLGLEVAGVAKGVFEVEVMVQVPLIGVEDKLACTVSAPMRSGGACNVEQ